MAMKIEVSANSIGDMLFQSMPRERADVINRMGELYEELDDTHKTLFASSLGVQLDDDGLQFLIDLVDSVAPLLKKGEL